MNIICEIRWSGKTTRTIKRSAQIWGTIVCHSREEASRIHQLAREMKLEIPFPITYSEFLRGDYFGKGIKNILIDNADMFLQTLTKVPIDTITITKESNSGINRTSAPSGRIWKNVI